MRLFIALIYIHITALYYAGAYFLCFYTNSIKNTITEKYCINKKVKSMLLWQMSFKQNYTTLPKRKTTPKAICISMLRKRIRNYFSKIFYYSNKKHFLVFTKIIYNYTAKLQKANNLHF